VRFAVDDGSHAADVETLARMLGPLLEAAASPSQLELWPSPPNDDH
jgi:hypothetical protein